MSVVYNYFNGVRNHLKEAKGMVRDLIWAPRGNFLHSKEFVYIFFFLLLFIKKEQLTGASAEKCSGETNNYIIKFLFKLNCKFIFAESSRIFIN